MENTFTAWLQDNMRRRNFSIRELARAANLSHSAISNVLNSVRNPGPDFCIAVAQALRVPPEDVFRRAGILPPIPTDEEYRQLVELLPLLSTDALIMLRRMAYALAQTEEPTHG